MITVRFPSGFSVQYNDLAWIEWGSGCHGHAFLYTRKGDPGWKVKVPMDAIIEFISPWRTYNAAAESHQEKISELTREVRLLKQTVARSAKRPTKKGT